MMLILVIDDNFENFNQEKQQNNLTIFDDIIADIISNKNPETLITKINIHGCKINVYFVFVTQSCLSLRKVIRLNSK